MEIIDEATYDRVEEIRPELIDKSEIISEDNISLMLKKLDNPVEYQKELAVQLKLFIDKRIKLEQEDEENLSESTRRWIETYNAILDRIHRALHGDKSVNLHLHKISHSDIAAKIRSN